MGKGVSAVSRVSDWVPLATKDLEKIGKTIISVRTV
jgi:hypothetical protein